MTFSGDEGGIGSTMALLGNVGEYVESKESWSQYIERLEQFFTANSIPDEKKASVLLSTIGATAYRTVGNLVAPRKPSEVTYLRIIEVMGDFYNLKPLVTVQRFHFYSWFRQPEESTSTFVAELRNLTKDCDFGASLEDNLRDRLVCGIADQVLQKRLLSEQNLTFKMAFEIAQSHKSAARNIVTLQGSSKVHQLKNDTDKLSLCYRCGRKGHSHTKCKFKSATCHFCGKIGHIKPVCRSRNSSRLQRSSTSISHHPSTISSPRSSDRWNRQSPDSSIRHRLSRSSAAHSSVKQVEESGPQEEFVHCSFWYPCSSVCHCYC